MFKLLITVGAGIGGFVGAYVPYIWGDDNFFGGWSILFSVLGGFVGIWLGYLLAKRISE